MVKEWYRTKEKDLLREHKHGTKIQKMELEAGQNKLYIQQVKMELEKTKKEAEVKESSLKAELKNERDKREQQIEKLEKKLEREQAKRSAISLGLQVELRAEIQEELPAVMLMQLLPPAVKKLGELFYEKDKK